MFRIFPLVVFIIVFQFVFGNVIIKDYIENGVERIKRGATHVAPCPFGKERNRYGACQSVLLGNTDLIRDDDYDDVPVCPMGWRYRNGYCYDAGVDAEPITIKRTYRLYDDADTRPPTFRLRFG